MRAIIVNDLSKRYFIGERPSDSLRDVVTGFFGNLRDAKRKKELWALRDVNFEANTGEAVGVIGQNGAGKSTLLKVLSRITRPTSGSAEIHGRVGSLLEVGTGFHNELTGRENVYLNGAILGMGQKETAAKFDEIVAFSEVEEFLDTPVKFYSSGMYMRLAFAVAAHLEPEILIVDEVIAVGDAGFQRKCLDKMQSIGEEGRTVLFVSHNLSAVSRFCSRTVWLEKGEVREDGNTNDVISNYLNGSVNRGAARIWDDDETAPGNETVRLISVRAADEDGNTVVNIDVRLNVILEVEYKVLNGGKVFSPAFHVYDHQGICVFGTNDVDPEWRNRGREPGRYKSRVIIPGNLLAEGTFYVSAAMFDPMTSELHLLENSAISFDVFDSLAGDSARGDYLGGMIGVIRPLLDWDTEFTPK
jgi:lipopolysaccharide transport system ATP-binding protein